MNIESAEPIHTLKLTEAIERHLGRACNKLKQLSPLFLVKRANGTPEPLDLW